MHLVLVPSSKVCDVRCTKRLLPSEKNDHQRSEKKCEDDYENRNMQSKRKANLTANSPGLRSLFLSLPLRGSCSLKDDLKTKATNECRRRPTWSVLRNGKDESDGELQVRSTASSTQFVFVIASIWTKMSSSSLLFADQRSWAKNCKARGHCDIEPYGALKSSSVHLNKFQHAHYHNHHF